MEYRRDYVQSSYGLHRLDFSVDFNVCLIEVRLWCYKHPAHVDIILKITRYTQGSALCFHYFDSYSIIATMLHLSKLLQ